MSEKEEERDPSGRAYRCQPGQPRLVYASISLESGEPKIARRSRSLSILLTITMTAPNMSKIATTADKISSTLGKLLGTLCEA
jgi:hypothetical protein